MKKALMFLMMKSILIIRNILKNMNSRKSAMFCSWRLKMKKALKRPKLNWLLKTLWLWLQKTVKVPKTQILAM